MVTSTDATSAAAELMLLVCRERLAGLDLDVSILDASFLGEGDRPTAFALTSAFVAERSRR